ncbi:nose resistant to fluoxetine protein 6-like [Tribolium madens]|uniref:nose resistant to fluoxetine protein 6-like n=1 Tax=Tribolium madens TaxID=41895 RepID=UPI001CF73A30|nr:nose resistant to fluoxetine protein 6-like [Tribolium madens]
MNQNCVVLIIILLIAECSCNNICDNLNNLSKDNITQGCLNQLDLICNNGSVLWQMFDASSKYPISGLSYSNNKDLGNFDECIRINYESFKGDVKGKFCGLSVAIVNPFLKPIPDPFIILKNKHTTLAEIATIRDISDEITITALSLCIPDQCTPREVGLYFLWGQFETTKLVNFVDKVPCMTKDSNSDFKWGDIVFTTVLALVLFLVVLCTIYDFMMLKLNREPQHPIYVSFSVLTNGRKLLNINYNPNPDQIQCLNGMRFISMMWVIAGHNFVAVEQVPIINYAEIKEFADNVRVQYVTSAPIAVDTFFFLSGFLLTFGYLKSARKMGVGEQISKVPMMIIHRYLRLTPAVIMLYLTIITIYRMIGTGPLWDVVTQTMSKPCEQYWWPFLLYIQNYYNYNDMCLTHTWYLSADMQMFILAPLVLIPLTVLIKSEKEFWAIATLCTLIVIAVVVPIVVRLEDDTIDNVYDTHSRFNCYLIGMLLGVIMRESKFQKFVFSKLVNLIIWCVVFTICITFNLYYHNVIRIYEHTKDTLFYGFYRPIWCLSLAWMVYSCHHGHGGPINWLLSLPAFQIGARLSYCMYLLHAVVIMYWVGVVRTPYFWGDYVVFYVWCGHFITTMVLSYIWSLAFESPMIVLEKYFWIGVERIVKTIRKLPFFK